MSFLQSRPLEGVDVSVVSEVLDLVELLQSTLRICGADAVTAAASCRQLMQKREGRGSDVIIVDSLTRDLDVRFLTWANGYGAAVVALTLWESDPRRRPEWLKAFNVRLLHSTDVRTLCNAIHDAVVRP
jgi:hypothetical protein